MDVNLTEVATADSTMATPLSATAATPLASAVATTPTPMSSAVSSKTLKRCLSVPIIHHLPRSAASGNANVNSPSMTTRSAAAAAAAAASKEPGPSSGLQTPKKYHPSPSPDSSVTAAPSSSTGTNATLSNIAIPRSNPSSREVSPAPVFNIFTPRARRYSASYSPLATAGSGGTGAPLCMTPRVSQLRQEECIDVNSREVNHEREVHSAMQMSQSWEDLTLVAENWSCKSDDVSNPLLLTLPSAGCASPSPNPSPNGNRVGLRLPYGLSPSPTRRTFATRRSMSPIAMRPSQLGPVKRKFELEESSSISNWNIYSPPPLKKKTTESRGSSPVCPSPSSVCLSPDSGTYDGRVTPKLFISKLCTTNTNGSSSSTCSSPMPAQMGYVGGSGVADSSGTLTFCTSLSSSSEPMCIGGNVDEGISMAESEEKTHCSTGAQPLSTDMQDDVTLMDDTKSETSSIGGCSSISLESSSCDSSAKSATTFLNKLIMDDSTASGYKSFFINKLGPTGTKKFVVNHDNMPNSSNKLNTGVGANNSTCVGASPSSSSISVDHTDNIGLSNTNTVHGEAAKLVRKVTTTAVAEELIVSQADTTQVPPSAVVEHKI